MGKLTVFSRNTMLDHVFNGVDGQTAAAWLALYTAATDEDGGGTECIGTGYGRVAITFSAATARRVTQVGSVSFTKLTVADWGTITHWAILDAETAGNMLAFGAFSSSLSPVIDNTPRVPSGEVFIEISATAAGGGITTFAANKLLDLVFRNIAWTPPIIHIAMSSTDIADAGTGMTEQTGTGYARIAVDNTVWNAAASGSIASGLAIVLEDSAAADWSLIATLAVMDALTAGNILAYDNVSFSDQTPGLTDEIQIDSGAAAFTIN